MTTPAPTPDTPPERILPTAAWPPTAQGEPLGVVCRRCHYGQSPAPADGVLVGACPECGFDLVPLEDVCRIYDTQAAQLAAGQALADAVRRWQAADELWRDLKHGDDLRAAGEASNLMFEAESALRTVDLAAFPAGGAR